MHLTLVCLLFIVVSMTVSARWGVRKASRTIGYAVRAAGDFGWNPPSWGSFATKRDYDASEEKQEGVLAEMFWDLDGNRDELIDIDELRDDMATYLKDETRTPEELMDETDTNGDGFIDYDDYDASEEKHEEVLAEMYLDLDGDQDGLIDLDELRDDMAYILQGETRTPEDLMADSDANGDGYIDFDEFVDDMNFDNLY